MALYRRHWSFTGATIFYRSKQPPQDVHKNHQQWELELPTNLYYICQDVKIRERTCWTFFNVILYLRVVEAWFSWPSERTIVCKNLKCEHCRTTLFFFTISSRLSNFWNPLSCFVKYLSTNILRIIQNMLIFFFIDEK